MRSLRILSLPIAGAVSVICGLALISSSSAVSPSGAKVVTFNKEVAPIFYKHCAECHRPGESAPMSLLTYKEARPWAKSIREKVISREMPPWHADPHVGQFANDRRLSQAEVETVAAWVEGGAKEGEARDLPPAPQFAAGWSIGRPDVVLQMPEEFALEASGPDEYQYFEIATNFTEDKYVQMAEARPGNRKVVHHILAFVVPPGAASLAKVPKEQRDKAIEASLKTSPFYRDGFLIRLKPEIPVYDDSCAAPEEMRRRSGGNDNILTGYAPGHNADVWEPGVAKKIPAGATLRLQVHYSKVAGSAQKDRSSIGLVFAKGEPERLMVTRSVSNIFFQIPPGAARHAVTACWSPREDMTLYALMPHMHYRGAGMEYKVFYPDGRSEVLLNVPNYSFSWQTNYALKKPVLIPQGSKLMVTGHFDNSAKNKANPDPTKTVRYGEPTYDEMMMGFMDFVFEKPPIAKVDPKIFDAYVGRYELTANLGVTVTRDGERLIGQATNQPKLRLWPETETKFFMREAEGRITFVRNDAGEVSELVLDQGGRVLRAKKNKEVVTSGGNN